MVKIRHFVFWNSLYFEINFLGKCKLIVNCRMMLLIFNLNIHKFHWKLIFWNNRCLIIFIYDSFFFLSKCIFTVFSLIFLNNLIIHRLFCIHRGFAHGCTQIVFYLALVLYLKNKASNIINLFYEFKLPTQLFLINEFDSDEREPYKWSVKWKR